MWGTASGVSWDLRGWDSCTEQNDLQGDLFFSLAELNSRRSCQPGKGLLKEERMVI